MLTLAMFDELAQDEADAEDYDMEALERRPDGPGHPGELDDDDATLVGRRGPGSIAEDRVVFEIGDEDAQSDDEAPSKKSPHQNALDRHTSDGVDHEREGLMNGGA
jgi:hypothetical protein